MRIIRPVRGRCVAVGLRIGDDATYFSRTADTDLNFDYDNERTIAFWYSRLNGVVPGPTPIPDIFNRSEYHPSTPGTNEAGYKVLLDHFNGRFRPGFSWYRTAQNENGVTVYATSTSGDIKPKAPRNVMITYSGTNTAGGVSAYWPNPEATYTQFNVIPSQSISRTTADCFIFRSTNPEQGNRPYKAGMFTMWNKILTTEEREAYFAAGFTDSVLSIAPENMMVCWRPSLGDDLSAQLTDISGNDLHAESYNVLESALRPIYDGEMRNISILESP